MVAMDHGIGKCFLHRQNDTLGVLAAGSAIIALMMSATATSRRLTSDEITLSKLTAGS